MSKNSIYKKNNFLSTNSSIQKLNDNVIQIFLEYYKYYPLSDEFKENIEKNKEIFESNPIKPDLVLRKEVFNKNICFIDANQEDYNYFPRTKFNFPNLQEEENISNMQNNIIKYSKEISPSFSYNSSLNNINNNKLTFMNSLIISGIDEIKPYVSGGIYDVDEKKDDIIYLISSFINIKGWNIFINGYIYLFTSYELFEFLTEEILIKNLRLDNIIISNIYSSEKLKGGYLYLYLYEYLPLFINNPNFSKCKFGDERVQLNRCNNNNFSYNNSSSANNYSNFIHKNNCIVNNNPIQNNYFTFPNYNNNFINGFNRP